MNDFIVEIVIPALAFVMTLVGAYFVADKKRGRDFTVNEALRTGPEMCKIALGLVLITAAQAWKWDWFKESRLGQQPNWPFQLILLSLLLIFSYMWSFALFHKIAKRRPKRNSDGERRQWNRKVALCLGIGLLAWVGTALFVKWGV